MECYYGTKLPIPSMTDKSNQTKTDVSLFNDNT